MNISKLKHKDIEAIKLDVKACALKEAKKKAVLLASALDQKIKDVLTIVEIDHHANIVPRKALMSVNRSAVMMDNTSGGKVIYENFKKIETRASVRVVFEMG